MEVSKLNLYQRLLKISDEVGIVAKSMTIKLSNTNSYKAVAEADVINAVKPLEVKYGIFSFPISHDVIESKELEREYIRNGIKITVIDQFVRVRSNYRFVNVDNPSEYIDTSALGDGVDSQDKSTGKAQTYADKYALLKTYKIPTGEDTDQEASKERVKEPVKAFANEDERAAKVAEISDLLGNDASKVEQWFKHFEVTAQSIPLEVANNIIERIKTKQQNA